MRQTWKFAGEPESDCTLTPHFSGSNLNAASARFCALQTHLLHAFLDPQQGLLHSHPALAQR